MSERVRHPAVPEPIEFAIDRDGNARFATECQPLRTVINTEALSADWGTTDSARGVVTITLEGKSVIYDRTGYDLAGNWICDLRIGQKRGIEG